MKYFIVNAFTDEPFRGNPAAVCLIEKSISENKMKLIASEFNLSETAFIEQKGDGFSLRWFTPAVEVDLCGHATLASAHILWENKLIDNASAIKFFTKSGGLVTRYEDGLIYMDFPNEAPVEAECPVEIIEGLNINPVYSGKNRFDYIIEVEEEETVYNLKPDFVVLSQIKTRGIIVTSRSEKEEYDFISRFFAPAVGVAEDPVTGSAHCCLCPYWSDKLGKMKMRGYQASRRGGIVDVELRGERVVLGGRAVTVSSGKFLV